MSFLLYVNSIRSPAYRNSVNKTSCAPSVPFLYFYHNFIHKACSPSSFLASVLSVVSSKPCSCISYNLFLNLSSGILSYILFVVHSREVYYDESLAAAVVKVSILCVGILIDVFQSTGIVFIFHIGTTILCSRFLILPRYISTFSVTFWPFLLIFLLLASTNSVFNFHYCNMFRLILARIHGFVFAISTISSFSV